MKKTLVSLWVLVLILTATFIVTSLYSSDPSPKIDEDKFIRIENSGYYRKGSKIFYSFTGDAVLSDVDSRTFKTLAHNVAKDAKHVYVENRIQSGIDTESFALYGYERSFRMYVSFFADKNGLYYLTNDQELSLRPSPFDPRRMEYVGGNYLKTENGIYRTGYDSLTKVEGVDHETFRMLGTCYSVEMSSGSYMIDKNHIYVGDQILEGADPETFEQIAVIPNGPDSEIPYTMTLWKDANRIYAHCGKVIVEADYATFEYLGDNKAQDKNNFYSLHTGGGYHISPRE